MDTNYLVVLYITLIYFSIGYSSNNNFANKKKSQFISH